MLRCSPHTKRRGGCPPSLVPPDRTRASRSDTCLPIGCSPPRLVRRPNHARSAPQVGLWVAEISKDTRVRIIDDRRFHKEEPAKAAGWCTRRTRAGSLCRDRLVADVASQADCLLGPAVSGTPLRAVVGCGAGRDRPPAPLRSAGCAPGVRGHAGLGAVLPLRGPSIGPHEPCWSA